MLEQSRSQLLTRKADLLAALRQLKQDRAEGTVDPNAYEAAKKRYEEESALLLQRLDTLHEEGVGLLAQTDEGRANLRRWASPMIFAAGAALLVVGGLVVFLITALHSGASNPAPVDPVGTKAASPRVTAAQQLVQAHPRDVADLITLGNAYLENGQPRAADGTYEAAMKLDPAAPQPVTLHAMILGYAGQTKRALTLLHSVEGRHPAYSRAWLLDGVFASRNTRYLNHAIDAWKRFLTLSPRSVMSRQVRSWIAGAEKAQKKHR